MPTIQDLVAHVVGDNLDRLITVDLRGQGMVKPIYEAARRDAGMPLTMYAAQRLDGSLTEGSIVLICTGFPGPHWESVPRGDGALAEFLPEQIPGETDGLVAAAALARALDLGYQSKPVVVTEKEILPMVAAALQAAGLHVFLDPDRFFDIPHSAVVLDFPKDEEEARAQVPGLLATLHPVAAVSIERPGRNDAGQYHMANGRAITPFVAKVDHLYTAVHAAGGLTVGIGDLGNELGLGTVQEACRRFTETGGRCRCACGQGIACTVDSDVTVVGAISDNVAHGVIAALAYLRGNPDLVPDARMEERLIEAVVGKGAQDGVSGLILPWIDGVRTAYHTRLVEQMRDIITYPQFFLRAQRHVYEWAAEHVFLEV